MQSSHLDPVTGTSTPQNYTYGVPMKRWNYNGQDINWNDPESIDRYCPEDEYEYLPEDEEVEEDVDLITIPYPLMKLRRDW